MPQWELAPPTPQPKTELQELASAITNAVNAAQVKQPVRNTELPIFNGSHQDYLIFRSAYFETSQYFSTIENTARLRRSLRGSAKEAVQGLLISNADPDHIMRTLELRFGRPESIATAEIEKLKMLPRLTDAPKDIVTFATKVENVVSIMEALGCIRYLYNPELTRNLVDKMTPTLKRQWYEFSAQQGKNEADLTKFSRFIRREAEICGPYAPPERIGAHPELPHRQHRVHTVQAEQPRCVVCGCEDHHPTSCKKFREADSDTRWDIAKKKRLCFRCLRTRKKSHSCSPRKCGVNGCERFHHRLLHHQLKAEERKEDPGEERVNSAWTPKVSFLKIAPIHISGPAGEVDTYALLDDGSTVTLIDADLADQIGAKGIEDPLHISTYDGTTDIVEKSNRISFNIRTRNSKEKISARTVENLQLAAQRIPEASIKDCPHLKDIIGQIRCAEIKPKILIGQDNWNLLLAKEVRTGRRNQPVASLTPLGWVIHGSHTRTLGHQVNFLRTSNEDSLEKIVKDYITADNLYVEPRRPNSDPGEKALRILEKYTQKNEEGRYQTALLWKSEDTVMPDNYDNTLKRLLNVENKLDKDAELKRKYNEQMEALIRKDYAEPAPAERSPKRTWYLPHFAVFNPMKPDKLRVVHDAAAKTRGTSLNDQLLTGPDLLQSLPGVIMRFRQYPIAVTADISEMFMQIHIRPEDRDALRYLWRGDRRDDAPPEEYRMKSLIFGASSSPATAIYVMNRNAANFEQEHPEAVDAIRRKHYMDDYLDSYRTIEEAVKIATSVREIHKHAHFQLRKWRSNSADLLAALGQDEGVDTPVQIEETGTERVLGLIWKPKEDVLTFNLDLARIPPALLQQEIPTKREALKIVMSLFDPLGLASPVTIQAKQLLQEIWRRGTTWDEKIDPDLAASWQKWLIQLKNLVNVSVPRGYPDFHSAASIQLHVFTDASETAYATALYWRTVSREGEVKITLIAAKTKVAPLKVTSIPRLELQAAVLGARMAAAVKQEHQQTPESTTFWTDSRTTLTWIRTGSRSYKPYVAHRVAAIEENSVASEWRWVPTKMNNADDATRNVPEDFDKDHRWFHGPEFLYDHPDTWPADDNTPVISGEEKTYSLNQVRKARLQESLPDVTRFSNWSRFLRSTARVLQFIDICRKKAEQINYKRSKKREGQDTDWRRNKKKIKKAKKQRHYLEKNNRVYLQIPAEKLRRAETLIRRMSQEDSFSEELKIMKAEKPLPASSRLHPLSVKLEDEEIRLNGRIEAASGIEEEIKNPMILDGNHRATRLWIDHVHRQLHHAGVEATINECKQRYWILRLRPTVKNIIKSCVTCRLRTAKPPFPITGNLPECRLAHHQRPFTYTGVDYFGPLSVTVGRSTQKRYVAIFTCLTTRAVHLEMVASLSSSSAIMALRRMITRRGCPKQIWSDNGTNFHGADKELRQAITDASKEEASRRLIEWRFIPPGAPFMGGAWERLVRSVKTALMTTLHERHPPEEVLQTLLAECEYTVNSRPLTHVSLHPEDPEALTPNHFLLGGPGGITAPTTTSDRDLDLRTSWRTSQRMADVFWARWLREYLPELRNRRQAQGRGSELKIGDVVFIVDGNLPRNTWMRGRVSAVYPGPDGVVRTVDVTTRGGTLRRPARKIVVITPAEDGPAPTSCDAR